VADNSRIEDLRRRVHKDPASIAFAQLAEECRRAGQLEESVEICRAGLAIHPGYLSARVTLGRALVELNQLDEALGELEHVLASAPENLAAIRGVAEIHHRRGELGDALHHYRAALALARNDPDLQETVNDLAKKVEPPKPPASADGLSLEQVTRELFANSPPPATPPHGTPPAAAQAPVWPVPAPLAAVPPPPASTPQESWPPALGADTPPATDSFPAEPPDTRAVATIAALEQWLAAIHGARTHQRA
jgi:tetratricopeptide (TPR) repeat protein